MVTKKQANIDSRQKKALYKLKASEAAKKKELEGQEYMEKMKLIRERNRYITSLSKGRYYLHRCNMMAEQINSGKIVETIDGATKTMELMRSEFVLMKIQAISAMRESHFAKQDLMKDCKQTEEQIEALEKDYYEGKIIREGYSDEYRRGKKARFVKDTDESKKS